MHYAAAMPCGEAISTSLVFVKTNREIKEKILNLQISLQEQQRGAQKAIEEICLRREIDPREVFEAQTEEAVTAYTSKIESSLGGGGAKTRSIIEELQKDLTNLHVHRGAIQHLKERSSALGRVERNLPQDDELQELSYDELVQFGF